MESTDRAACRDVVIAFTHHLDHREFERAADLFAVDGVWDRHGERLHGRERIRETIAARDARQVERHVITNLLVTPESATECFVVSYVTIYRTVAADDEIPTLSGPTTLGEFHDRLRLVDGEWKLVHRSARPVFSFTMR